jgi:hypothetical protein
MIFVIYHGIMDISYKLVLSNTYRAKDLHVELQQMSSCIVCLCDLHENRPFHAISVILTLILLHVGSTEASYVPMGIIVYPLSCEAGSYKPGNHVTR